MPAKKKLSDAQVADIRRRTSEANPPSDAELATQYNVHPSTIRGIRIRKLRKNVGAS